MRTRVLTSVVLFSLLASSPVPASPNEFKVIVNASVAGGAITKGVLTEIYLGKTLRWKDNSPITPIDHSATSPLRASFSESVLGMPVFAVQTHWMRQMAAGARPPQTKTTDVEVIELVASRTGSIGYVSADAALPASVRAVAIQ